MKKTSPPTPLLEAEGSNKNYLLNKKKSLWFFVVEEK
jgi:hypothetical protein